MGGAGHRPGAKPDAQDPVVFLVHLWPHDEPAAVFRASVRRVDCDQLEFFTQAAALSEYFQREAGANVGQSALLRATTPGCLRAQVDRAMTVLRRWRTHR